MPYFYVALTVIFTVYGQLVLKWRIEYYQVESTSFFANFIRLIKIIFSDPLIFSGLVSAFFASIFWMLAVSKLELSSAYPLTSASFVLVFIASAILFGEPISLQKLIGISLIVVGIIIIGRAM
ncbi:EamA family transporter [Vibrio cholerae]|uniref:EamA family transporter n=2 Tax=Vibrio cholerae TaxID=666 RepID=UPI000E0A78BC|nr:EamA family transporter [Vibrio cholerae]EGR1835826.1 hypothetical protein [Vibrio cholerae]EGR4363011.1 hypothetical protein [Vibrio cholerae]EJL6470926.1 EamA family transporter [Vibrio cholerae]EJL6553660.1 EamA family transporter [Vibrio cholerae]